MTARVRAPLLAILVACAPRAPEPAASPAGERAVGDDAPVVTLERTPCFGTCPVYTVAIWDSGTVRFEGKHHTAHTGQATATVPAARVDSLVAALDSAGYFEFADAYVMSSPACGPYATDSPSVITSVTRDGVTKTIRHDRGCAAAPPELSRMEQRIDQVAGTAKWLGR